MAGMDAKPQPTEPRPAAEEVTAAKREVKTVEVASVEPLTPQMVRLVLTGPDLDKIPALPFTDHYVKLFFPPEGADYDHPVSDPDAIRESRPRELWPVTRTYSIRAFDRAARRLTLDCVIHDHGLAGRWMQTVRPGARVSFRGPGGAWAPPADAGTVLLAGDESALPAIARAMEEMPPGATPVVFCEVADAAGEIAMPGPVTWVHRGQAEYGQALVHAVRTAELPGEFDAFVHGVAEMIKELRRYLFVERGVPRDRVSISGYWRIGMTEDEWQSSKKEFVAAMENEEASAAGR